MVPSCGADHSYFTRLEELHCESNHSAHGQLTATVPSVVDQFIILIAIVLAVPVNVEE
jgi:hypothetical protein